MKITVDRDWKCKLKFIRVNMYSFIFSYGDRRFIMTDYDGWWRLYEMKLEENGSYTTEFWGEIHTDRGKLLRLRPRLKKKARNTLVYSQLDKEYFCIQMTASGLMSGYFEPKVKQIVQRNIEIQQKIDSLNSIVADLRSQIYRF